MLYKALDEYHLIHVKLPRVVTKEDVLATWRGYEEYKEYDRLVDATETEVVPDFNEIVELSKYWIYLFSCVPYRVAWVLGDSGLSSNLAVFNLFADGMMQSKTFFDLRSAWEWLGWGHVYVAGLGDSIVASEVCPDDQVIFVRATGMICVDDLVSVISDATHDLFWKPGFGVLVDTQNAQMRHVPADLEMFRNSIEEWNFGRPVKLAIVTGRCVKDPEGVATGWEDPVNGRRFGELAFARRWLEIDDPCLCGEEK